MNPQNLVKITFICKKGEADFKMSIYHRENIYINYEDTVEKMVIMYLDLLDKNLVLDQIVAIEYLGKVFI